MENNHSVKYHLKKLFIQRYERYLPTAFDESLTLLEKMNQMIEAYGKLVDVVNTHTEHTGETLERGFEIIDDNLELQLDNFTEELEQQKTYYEEIRDKIHSDLLPESVKQKLDEWMLNGTITELINEDIFSDYIDRIEIIENKTEFMHVNVRDFGAMGDGEYDDTNAIKQAIEYASTRGREVLFPQGKYLISDTITTDGVSLYGDSGNIFDDEIGSIIVCETNDFTAIKQGSTSARDIQFEYKNLIVENADVGFEINYVINSEFSKLYVRDSRIAYKLGDKEYVGSMFNRFNNLYSTRCEIGIESESNEYFNNNIFNNGFIQGDMYAIRLRVNGGYGAINNTFNNVELRSRNGRGLIADRAQNTILNGCYLECGASAVYSKNASNVILNECVYSLFKENNDYDDDGYITIESNAGSTVVDDGTVYLTSNESEYYFISTGNRNQHRLINSKKTPRIINRNLSPNFKISRLPLNVYLTKNNTDKYVELVYSQRPIKRNEIYSFDEYDENSNDQNVDNGRLYLEEGTWLINFRIRVDYVSSVSPFYVYLRKNGANDISYLDLEGERNRYIEFTKIYKMLDGDYISVIATHDNEENQITIQTGFLEAKFLG